jgi:hypothetical protein
VDDGDAVSTSSTRKTVAALERRGVYAHGNSRTLTAFFHKSTGPFASNRKLVRRTNG